MFALSLHYKHAFTGEVLPGVPVITEMVPVLQIGFVVALSNTPIQF